MHAKCLTTIGRTKPECLSCDEIKVKPEPRGGNGGDPPNPDDDGHGGDGWYGGKGRRIGEREKKLAREDLISKIASRVLTVTQARGEEST
eukprot:3805632-Amphidinium_carterae.1